MLEIETSADFRKYVLHIIIVSLTPWKFCITYEKPFSCSTVFVRGVTIYLGSLAAVLEFYNALQRFLELFLPSLNRNEIVTLTGFLIKITLVKICLTLTHTPRALLMSKCVPMHARSHAHTGTYKPHARHMCTRVSYTHAYLRMHSNAHHTRVLILCTHAGVRTQTRHAEVYAHI